jgi:PAS domain S-box-containing protein
MNEKQAVKQMSTAKTSTHDLTFIRALNAAAATIQQNATGLRDNVFLAFKEQVTKLDLRGGIGVLGPDRKTLVFTCVAYPPGSVKEVLLRIAAKLGMKLENYSIPYDSVDIYREIIENRRTIFVSESSSILKQVAPVTALPLMSQLIKLISSTPGIYAPLVGKDKVMGLISIQGNNLHEGNVEEITAFANHLATALENTTLMDGMVQSEERFRVVVENALDGILIVKEGVIKYANPRIFQLIGYSPEEVIGRHMSELPGMEQNERLSDLLSVAGQSSATSEACEVNFISRQGTVLNIEIRMKSLHYEGAIALLISLHDVTEHRKTEAELSKAQRLESLGVLAGGIAHDFNNLLAGIFGYIDLARSVLKDEQAKEYLEATLGSMNRARALTLQLLTFAKGGAPVKKITPLIPFIRETAQFALSGSTISCKFFLAENLWPCNIDKNQIGQVIDNIVINARQAMPNGGSIEIAAGNISIRDKEHSLMAKGDYVKVSIKDSGIGIPKDIMPRIFEPFYTTKTQGHGLGLATCYSIVKRHGGAIDVESEQGKGSTFHVYLPASVETILADAATIITHKGSGTIIVMDDEEVMRTTLRKMLESLGYTVVCKSDGKECVDFFINESKANRQFAAMIFDLTIPGGMGGMEAVREIRKLNTGAPKVPVFVVSGYTDSSVMTNPVEYGFTASFSKPFTIAELSAMLEKYLTAKI